MEMREIIKQRREQLDLTLEEVGKAVGVSKATVQRWESGNISNLRRDKIAKLADVLKLSPITFITGDIVYKTEVNPLVEKRNENDNVMSLTSHEKSVVTAYRNKPELQPAVDKLLDVPAEQQEVLVAARNGGLKKRPITDDEQRIIKEDSQVSEEL
ncbi:MAG: helix-turn-helix transcriptional regulator [Oscillospiraceae bacterium]|nr:helix-turn-helix transcriptional regulator [Oscillospiraceae bacterium]